MGKFLFLFVTILLTLFFVNYKFSTAIRILAYQEIESKKGAIFSFTLMIVLSILWAFILS